ncbi:MAG TPA: NTP transferase domain-containing protein, partial [Chthoniobacterales bacterium]|nr:NTP transferase domain-containing protein [Chthoniobacterales bacterium]
MTKKTDQAVILAAGRGTRMRELTADLPKPMIQVRGKPVLQHIVDGLRDAGVQRLVIVVGYRGDAVATFFGGTVEYVTQEVQDGTGRV